MQMREAIFEDLYNKYRNKDYLNTYILSNDFGAQKLDIIRELYPKQFINCGISEQNQIGVGAGMGKVGLIPIFYSIASFYMRAAEQIKVDIAVPNVKCIFLGVGAGYGYSADGPTHHSIEDIGLFNNFDEFDIIVPISSQSAVHYFHDSILNRDKPVYLRLDRDTCLDLPATPDGFHLIAGNGTKSKPDRKKLVISCGYLAAQCVNHFSGEDIDICIIEDFNCAGSEKLQQVVNEYTDIVIAEEHVARTGLGSHLKHSIKFQNCELTAIGLTDRPRFSYNHRNQLLRSNSIDPTAIEKILSKEKI